MDELRRPGAVSDLAARPIDRPGTDVRAGVDTDGDGRPDTTVLHDGVDLVLLTDLDGDSYADQVLRIGPDGVTRHLGSGLGNHPLDGDSDLDAW